MGHRHVYERDENRVVAECLWFDLERGYGFLKAPGVNRDVFIHIQQLNDNKIFSLAQGDKIEVTLVTTNKGVHAEDPVAA
jgi:cold shock CspA family protein